MLAIEKTLISDELLDKQFVCDLQRCKGACCVAGDAGAPLEEEELAELKKIYPSIKAKLLPAARSTIESAGLYVRDAADGSLTTPLVNGEGACVYAVFENNIAKCTIEQAYEEKKIKWKKPISCHLYPVRITSHKNYDALNYHHWNVCKAACKLGKSLEVPVYKFLKEPLIRKYGKSWYGKLVLAADALRPDIANED